MRISCLLFAVIMLWAHLVFAQTQTTSVATLRDDDPVITVNEPCGDSAQPGQVCRTVVTRAQFDQLCDALQPNMKPEQRLKVANAYARNLRMAAAAELRGLDQTAAFGLEMQYARLQLLAQDLEQTMQNNAHRISDADLNTYYTAHQSDFETAAFDRIFVPHVGQSPELNADAMQRLAEEVRGRLLAGESADQLQREVFVRARLPVASGNTKIEQVRRDVLPPNHVSVMQLARGEVALISDPEGAHFIYRMLDKRLPTLEQSTGEIGKLIAAQRYRDSSREFEGNSVFSDAYFNPAPQNVVRRGSGAF